MKIRNFILISIIILSSCASWRQAGYQIAVEKISANPLIPVEHADIGDIVLLKSESVYLNSIKTLCPRSEVFQLFEENIKVNNVNYSTNSYLESSYKNDVAKYFYDNMNALFELDDTLHEFSKITLTISELTEQRIGILPPEKFSNVIDDCFRRIRLSSQRISENVNNRMKIGVIVARIIANVDVVITFPDLDTHDQFSFSRIENINTQGNSVVVTLNRQFVLGVEYDYSDLITEFASAKRPK